jgi:hypothetical protein
MIEYKNSIISKNDAIASVENFGGGIFNFGTAELTECTISDNLCGNPRGHGGGIWIDMNGILTITNSTISDNVNHNKQYSIIQ